MVAPDPSRRPPPPHGSLWLWVRARSASDQSKPAPKIMPHLTLPAQVKQRDERMDQHWAELPGLVPSSHSPKEGNARPWPTSKVGKGGQ